MSAPGAPTGALRLGAPGAPVERAREIDLRGAFERVTMQELFEEACGFDLLEANCAFLFLFV